ncbi:MAG: response regulator [Alicyclobacillus macrosporangiidus]|nr:response regulator [Alicyclobacillus macrosporangiidus]
MTEDMPIRVLLVDDVPETLQALYLQYSLHPSVEVIGVARTISEALCTLKSTPANLVSVDIYMGDENGLDLCRLLHDRFPDIFIIICSIADSALLRNMAYESGAHYFIPKPVSYKDVCAVTQAYRRFSQRKRDCVHVDDDVTTWIEAVLTDLESRK